MRFEDNQDDWLACFGLPGDQDAESKPSLTMQHVTPPRGKRGRSNSTNQLLFQTKSRRGFTKKDEPINLMDLMMLDVEPSPGSRAMCKSNSDESDPVWLEERNAELERDHGSEHQFVNSLEDSATQFFSELDMDFDVDFLTDDLMEHGRTIGANDIGTLSDGLSSTASEQSLNGTCSDFCQQLNHSRTPQQQWETPHQQLDLLPPAIAQPIAQPVSMPQFVAIPISASQMMPMTGLAPQLMQTFQPMPINLIFVPSPVTFDGTWSPQPGLEMESESKPKPKLQQEYRCAYCTKSKFSSSAAAGRVRIRCECGGQYKDGKSRMHATWIAVPKEEKKSVLDSSAIVQVDA